MAIDSGRIEAAVAELLSAIGEDPARPGLLDTPRRVAEAYREFFAGLVDGGVESDTPSKPKRTPAPRKTPGIATA